MAGATIHLAPIAALAPSLCLPDTPPSRFPPINFIYGHFHNAIRAELSLLAGRVRSLEASGDGSVEATLNDLRERYRFLGQVYKYHSALEDEVLYPVLDAKVRNVTLAYSIEHQDEEILFEELSQLMAAALVQPESERKGTIRALICKVEEIHTTLSKHLAKEEEQLLPLLLKHFSFAEQAELVAQFLYSIPLETVERVLAQLKPHIPRAEQEQLLEEIQGVIPDNLLSQLLTTWLKPAAPIPSACGADVEDSWQAAGADSGALKAQGSHCISFGGALAPACPARFTCCGNRAACVYEGGLIEAPTPGCGLPAGAAQGREGSEGGPCAGASPAVSIADTGASSLAADASDCSAAGAAAPRRISADGASTDTRRGALPCSPPSSPTGLHMQPSAARAPLQDIIHFHRSICSALGDFAREARSLLEGGECVTAPHLSALLERHRFLRSVYVFHSISEEEVLFPEVQRLLGGAAAQECEADHANELSAFEDLGRLLADVRSFARRGRKEVAAMLAKLVAGAEAVHGAIERHMQREEADVFPLLEAALCTAHQRSLVYRTLRAMPLRLLERVMPWVVGRLDNASAAALLSNIRLGAPAGDSALVELLSRWARRGRRDSGSGAGAAVGKAGPAADAAPARTDSGASLAAGAPAPAARAAQCPHFLRDSVPAAPCYVATSVGEDGADSKRRRMCGAAEGTQAERQGEEQRQGGGWDRTRCSAAADEARGPRRLSGSAGGCGGPQLNRPGSGVLADEELSTAPRALMLRQAEAEGGPERPGETGPGRGLDMGHAGTGSGSSASRGSGGGFTPIDHIFQFHRALRLELKQLEADAMALEAAVAARVRAQQQREQGQQQQQGGQGCEAGPAGPAPQRSGLLPLVQNLHGRFQFLQGIYRAHSKAEDEIVFPALESKQALRNVSHAYTLDHRQEEALFAQLEQVIDTLRSADLSSFTPGSELPRAAMAVRRMCAAIRASLETHVRSEESELWPLFTEHFSREEQQYLVGVIIGRTGAQVLQALLPWVSETFSAEEKAAMMDSLREATRHTMFDQWLEAVQASGGREAGPQGAQGQGQEECPGDVGRDVAEPLQQVAEYLAGSTSSREGGVAVGPGVAAGGPSGAAGAGAVAGAGPGGGAVADSTSFRPGWEDIFRMNQQQLEAAIHRVSNDSSLEPERKAYLMQNIMVSKYIVAQQKRMTAGDGAHGDTEAGAGGSAGAGPAPRPEPVPPAIAPAAAPAASAPTSGTVTRTYHNQAAGVLGCQHYQRKCQLVAPCCAQVHTCRLCHDEASEHRMDRYAVSEMRCMLCGERQPVGATCRACASPMARYTCDICHLFDDEPGKDIYHCPFCNVCRRGRGLGVDFFHCMNCNACMSLSLFSAHTCRVKCTEGNCPVCHEALFDSNVPIKELPCGHFMHSACFCTYTQYNYTCPLCCRSAGDMSVYFNMLDSLLAAERLHMPPEYAGRMQQVLCNDCGKMGFAPFHFVYHACPHCRSYNTRVL